MSRSFRRPCSYNVCGADPNRGKMFLSRRFRRKAKAIAHKARFLHPLDLNWFDFFIDHPQDRKRGYAGSRDYSWGWDYYGDGRGYYGYRKNPNVDPDNIYTRDLSSDMYRRKWYRRRRNPWGAKVWKEATEWTIKSSRK